MQIPEKKPSYRGDREHTEFLTTLQNELPVVTSKSDFAEAIETSLIQKLNFDLRGVGLAELDLQENASHETQLSNASRDFYPRSKAESLIEHWESVKKIPSLIKVGPSCSNL